MTDIIVDITMLLEDDGPPHGISRLVAQAVAGLTAAGEAVGFIHYNAQHEQFRRIELPPGFLNGPEAPSPDQRSSARVVTAPPVGPSPAPAGRGRVAGRIYYAVPRRPRLLLLKALHHAAESARNVQAGARALVAEGVARRAARDEPAVRDLGPFQPESGQAVLQPGALWGHPGIANALGAIAASGAVLTTVVCDVIPLVQPQFFQDRFCANFAHWCRATLLHSRRILTISHATAADLRHVAARDGLPCPPIEVLRLGDDGLGAAPDQVDPAVAALADRPMALSLGTLEVRKNHLLLYRAWRRMLAAGRTPPRLVIAGRRGWLADETHHLLTHDPLLHGHVVLLHDASDGEVAWLMERALFTLYPSLYEGWGLPVAESLARGRVVLASNTPAVVEAGQGLARHIDPDDVPGWCDSVLELIGDADRRRALEETIARDYRLVTWRDTADRLADLIRTGGGRAA